MKKSILILFLLIHLSGFGLGVDKDEAEGIVVSEAHYLMKHKDYDRALSVINRGIKKMGDTKRLIHTKYKILLAAQKYEKALEVFETIIEMVGDRPDVVIDKIRLQVKLKKFDQALVTALETDKKSEGSSPYISLFVFEIYLGKNEIQNAYMWMEKTISRGFRTYDYFLDKKFKILHKDYRFMDLIGQMKKNAGIGKPHIDFSLPQFSGFPYSVARDKGNVILLDFWATWCPPCVAEYPNLSRLYKEYRDKGFQIVSISADFKREALESFVKNHPIPWVNGFSGLGNKDKVVSLYSIDSFPTYILVDRKGIVRFLSSKGGELLEKEVSRLMEES